MGITLMTDIPDNGIFRTVEGSVQGDGKFYNSQVTGKMTAVFSNNINDCLTDFTRQLVYFFWSKILYVFW